jgi:hypothetical protein
MLNLTIIINCGPCEQYIGKCIWSLRRQKYRNWKAVVMVDPCKDRTYERAVASRGNDQRIDIVCNSRRYYSMANLLRATKRSAARPDDVMVVLDGDDWFFSDGALQTIAETYARHDCWMTYGSWIANIVDGEGKRPGQWPAYEEGIRDFRKRKWLGTAVRTWKRWLFDLIQDEDLRDDQGKYLRVTEDMAVMFPMLEMCGTSRAKHIAKPLIVYNRQNPHACNLVMREEMFRNDAYVRRRAIYEALPTGFTPLTGPLPDPLEAVLAREFGSAGRAAELLTAFLRRPTYDRRLCQTLLDTARGRSRDTWEIRCLATLMLEYQVLRLPLHRTEEFAVLSGLIGIDRDGVSLEELQRKLSRLGRVHANILGTSTPPEGLAEFIAQSRSECRLALGRYVFKPREVAARIVSQLRVTHGIPHEFPGGPELQPGNDDMVYDARGYEDEILRILCGASKIFWVSDHVASAVNSLVEHPLGTVALAIKPPGSDLEIEIKRAGVRGEQVVSVVHRRGAVEVPTSHRYHGGSAAWLLEAEAAAAERLDELYFAVHGVAPPIGRMRGVCSVIGIPTARGEEAHVLDYFTDPDLFGSGFEAMRKSMRQCVAAFDREGRDREPLNLPGDLGLTSEFLSHVAPRQAILSGTSSFRLDALSAYLSDEGPARYFRDGLRVTPSSVQLKRFADELLDEVLGTYSATPQPYTDHAHYVAATMNIPENRERADACYLALMAQFGTFWGTLLALRGFSDGESFVARNVGLKSVWKDGDWRVNLIFMDHDCLHLPSVEDEDFDPFRAAPGFNRDGRHIRGNTGVNALKGSINHLKDIYRVRAQTADAGNSVFRDEMRRAYQFTQERMREDDGLRSLFDPEFLERYFDWDAVVCLLLEHNARGTDWRAAVEEFLESRGYAAVDMRSYRKGLERSGEFLEHYAFLYEAGTLALNCS